jgi:hydrogenase/urease accessory protein HupE
MIKNGFTTIIALATISLANPALAHEATRFGGLEAGLLHPVTGLDHVVRHGGGRALGRRSRTPRRYGSCR